MKMKLTGITYGARAMLCVMALETQIGAASKSMTKMLGASLNCWNSAAIDHIFGTSN